ncbi:MAG: ATP-binding cassette domain-containing protein [Desmonostoc vinosum HA7617-LM4]|jgi:ATP-binding cassette subfamily B protein|nr:ATP-binding cassette domain-containing protein [Desmonostoc vinosum HA7617-LM4]
MNSSSSLRVQGDLKYVNQNSPTLKAAILNLLRLVAGDTSIGSDFSQVWVIREFQLGDELTSYGLDQETADDSNSLYLVCQGRVRLLTYDATIEREVSTQLITTEQTFGADHLFYKQPLPYRAIAASAGLIARIKISELKRWLQHLPSLENYLQRFAVERQALIFFKSCTELRSLTSLTLRQLLPLLIKTHISAGSSLTEATPASKGRFWLVSGKIDNSSPDLGKSWGYPGVTPQVAAQTDLLVYHLPFEYWESARAIAPHLFPNQHKPEIQQASHNSSDSHLESKLQTTHEPKYIPKLIELPPRKPRLDSPVAVRAAPEISFPRPQPSTRLRRPYPFIQQQSSSDCGAACLAMISQYWGKRLSINTLRDLARINRVGASLQGLAEAAQTLGYEVLLIRASFEKLDLYYNPWIAHWQGNHYVVVWRVKGDRILVSDPAIGKRSLSRREFAASWTGYALLLDSTERLDAVKSEKLSWSRYWQTLLHHRKLLRRIILASVLVQVFGLTTPLLAQVVLDRVMSVKNFLNLNVFATGFLILGIWRIILTAQRQYLLDYFANRIDLTLISSFIHHILQLPLQFFASRQVEDITSRVQENRKIQMFLTRQVISAALDAVMVLIYLGLMVYYNLQLTLLVLAMILPGVFLTVGTSPMLKKVSREIFQESARQNSSLVEIVAGVTTVKTAAAERPVQRRWQELFMNMVKVRFRGQKLATNVQTLRSLINHLGSTVVLWLGATLVMRQQMSLGHFVAFNMLAVNVVNPVLGLIELWDKFQEVQISVERLNDVLAAQPEENPQKPLMVIPAIRGDVDFENVSFRYNQDEDRNTLQNISFAVKAGQTIGIIGQSGSGKSTLVNLLAGLYRPKLGKILIDGHDISLVSPQSLRSRLGLVSQDCFLFAGTILENITLHSSEFTLEEAIAAANLAQAHDSIQELPLGYNTVVGERGLMLSGGQRQRIAIARALIRNPSILIFDEATSALDVESERLFQQNLIQISQSRTTFIVSHRLSSVRHADCILVLDRGILTEQGTHQELLAIGGLYYHLAQLQLNM